MVKKTHSLKIKLPGIEYKWTKELMKEEPNVKVIENQIKNFLFVIQNKENFKLSDFREELRAFTKLVVSQGYVTKLNKEYQNIFLEINKFVKEIWDGPVAFNYRMW